MEISNRFSVIISFLFYSSVLFSQEFEERIEESDIADLFVQFNGSIDSIRVKQLNENQSRDLVGVQQATILKSIYYSYGMVSGTLSYVVTNKGNYINKYQLALLKAPNFNVTKIQSNSFNPKEINRILRNDCRGIRKIKFLNNNSGVYNDHFIGIRKLPFNMGLRLYEKSGRNLLLVKQNFKFILQSELSDNQLNQFRTFLLFSSNEVDPPNNISRQRQILLNPLNSVVISDAIKSEVKEYYLDPLD